MEKNAYLCLLFCFYCSIASSLSVGAKVDDVSVLLEIKAGLNDPSDLLRDWKAPTGDIREAKHHCNWTGVECNSMGSVESLDLSHMNISGNVSDSISHLPSLVYLNLCCNAFSSSLPKAFSNLSKLRVFDVSDNLFVGEFPTGLGASEELRSVNSSGNNFFGSLPEDLGNATSLENLDFRGSYFNGSIPESYKNLQKLKFLGISGNSLSGRFPGFLGELSSLETLIVGYNEFEGPIPAELGNLTNLRYLDMAVGSFNGAIPATLGRLKHLSTMYLFRNQFEGEIPKELGDMPSLAFLDLSDNRINGTIPTELTRLPNLQLLNLMCNRLTGSVPAAIGNMTNLEVLELWNNSLTGSLPADLGLHSLLQWLDVSSNSFSGEIPSGLCSSGNLTKLILFDNDFTGPIPTSLTSCLALVRVRIHNNRLNGSIPEGLGKLPVLQHLELASNELTGRIPADIALSTSLSFFDISDNRLQFSLPFDLFSIPTLQNFVASGNSLTGPLPGKFENCLSLTVLNLSNNHHTGEIPASLGSCARLVNLDLSNNNFTGEIPKTVATMPSLSVLDLSENHLSGPIPPNLGTSPALEMLNVSYNNLSGPVPANGVLRTINPDDLAGNVGLCGSMLLTPCSSLSSLTSAHQRSLHLKHIAIGWAVGIAAVLVVGIILLGLRWLYQKWDFLREFALHGRFSGKDESQWPWRLTVFQRLNFTTSEILSCVKESNVIGMGATGIVYKAEITRNGTTVAIKKLWRSDSEGEMETEVSLLGRLRHRNVVRMLGCLRNDSDMMIVYEYMANGSLWEVLHGGKEPTVLVDWVGRYNVAVGVAQGLAYLHHDCHPPVIHRDIKSSNVLLDGNSEAKIADFGLAKAMVGKDWTVSVVAGSCGYIAPEYAFTMKVDHRSDIYSFGVVLMELITGKKPVEPEFSECQDIVGWVREKLKSNKGLEDVLDCNVGGQCQHVKEEMLLVLRIAILCTARLPKDRPSMRDVLTMLAEAKPRRKSISSSSAVVNAVVKDKPVFSTMPDSDYV